MDCEETWDFGGIDEGNSRQSVVMVVSSGQEGTRQRAAIA